MSFSNVLDNCVEELETKSGFQLTFDRLLDLDQVMRNCGFEAKSPDDWKDMHKSEKLWRKKLEETIRCSRIKERGAIEKRSSLPMESLRLTDTDIKFLGSLGISID